MCSMGVSRALNARALAELQALYDLELAALRVYGG